MSNNLDEAPKRPRREILKDIEDKQEKIRSLEEV